jgi:hypothetical protein
VNIYSTVHNLRDWMPAARQPGCVRALTAQQHLIGCLFADRRTWMHGCRIGQIKHIQLHAWKRRKMAFAASQAPASRAPVAWATNHAEYYHLFPSLLFIYGIHNFVEIPFLILYFIFPLFSINLKFKSKLKFRNSNF